jgi:prophage antirepressor-like protein
MDGEAWFMLVDVCGELEREFSFINEPGFYRIAALMRDNPGAKKFKRRVVHEVLLGERKKFEFGIGRENI